MTRLIGFAGPARLELLDAISFYEAQQAGLGLRFEAQVDATLRRILADPTIFRFVTATVQKARIHKFPHSVYFVGLRILSACLRFMMAGETRTRFANG